MNLDRIQDSKIYLHGPGCCSECGPGRSYHGICDVCGSEPGWRGGKVSAVRLRWEDSRSEDGIYIVINTHEDIPIPRLKQNQSTVVLG